MTQLYINMKISSKPIFGSIKESCRRINIFEGWFVLNINTYKSIFYILQEYRYYKFKNTDWKDAHPIHDSIACGERIKDEEREEETSTMSSLFGIFLITQLKQICQNILTWICFSGFFLNEKQAIAITENQYYERWHLGYFGNSQWWSLTNSNWSQQRLSGANRSSSGNGNGKGIPGRGNSMYKTGRQTETRLRKWMKISGQKRAKRGMMRQPNLDVFVCFLFHRCGNRALVRAVEPRPPNTLSIVLW